MAPRRKISRGPRSGDNGAHWISYSDMMASLLLVFVLAVVYSVYQYYTMLELKTQQLNEQKAELDRATITLALREDELEAANVTLMGKQQELAALQIQLQDQQEDLYAAQTALKTKEDEQTRLQLQLLAQQSQMKSQQNTLNLLSAQLDQQKLEMQLQQQKMEALLGVRTEIIAALSQELSRANLKAAVDPATGDIVLDSAIFFASSKYDIKPEGKELLSRFVPVYLGVLLRPEYADYVGEIIIEGHTDTAGSYMVNLELSQNRALSVAEYCLNMNTLSYSQQLLFQNLMTAKGRSYSDPIYNPDGTVNMDQSRRVEFKFRLKDTEMIQEINRILSQME